MTQNKKHEIYLAYEFWHADEAQMRAQQNTTIICLNFFAERKLEKKNVSFVSLREIIDTANGGEKWWELSHEISREWYRLPAMNFFKYNDIRIAEATEPRMQAYLSLLFYYVRIYRALGEDYPDAHFTIPAPLESDTSKTYYLAFFIAWAPVHAARMAGLKFTIFGTSSAPATYSFPQASWKRFFIKAYNLLIGLLPRRGLKIYASEYWTNPALIVPYLHDTELVIMDSKMFTKIPWQLILKHKIRIRNLNEMGDSDKRVAIQISEEFAERWEIAKEEVSTYLSKLRKDLNWGPVLDAFEYLIKYAPHIITDIRILFRIMMEEKPDLVFQMASVGSRQHHFFLMAHVAALLKIPSVELQHAGATIDPRSIYSRIETDYLATYGTDVNKWHERIGHAPDRLVAVGSPRFDQYINERVQGTEKGKQLLKKFGLDPARPVLLAVVPVAENYVSMSDSYQLAGFFEAIRSVQQTTPGLQILFKFHSNAFGAAAEYIRELFPTDSAVVGSEKIFPLLCASSAAVCNNSTVIYEAVLAQKPLILCPWWTHDTYHAQVYERAAPLFYTAQEAVDSIARIFTDPSYRDGLMARQKEFLKEYSFDGRSSERVATLLRELAQRGRK